ncbi:MAG: hypothetical protein WC897_03790 [Candidatus Gracilibacteria bacterium]
MSDENDNEGEEKIGTVYYALPVNPKMTKTGGCYPGVIDTAFIDALMSNLEKQGIEIGGDLLTMEPHNVQAILDSTARDVFVVLGIPPTLDARLAPDHRDAVLSSSLCVGSEPISFTSQSIIDEYLIKCSRDDFKEGVKYFVLDEGAGAHLIRILVYGAWACTGSKELWNTLFVRVVNRISEILAVTREKGRDFYRRSSTQFGDDLSAFMGSDAYREELADEEWGDDADGSGGVPVKAVRPRKVTMARRNKKGHRK